MVEDLTYHKEGEFMIPDIQMPEDQEQELKSLGRYGRMALRYLQANEADRYRTLYRFGKLGAKMKEVEEEANSLMDSLTEQYLAKHKPKDPSSTMEMWRLREQARMEAEEIVLDQVVMTFH